MSIYNMEIIMIIKGERTMLYVHLLQWLLLLYLEHHIYPRNMKNSVNATSRVRNVATLRRSRRSRIKLTTQKRRLRRLNYIYASFTERGRYETDRLRDEWWLNDNRNLYHTYNIYRLLQYLVRAIIDSIFTEAQYYFDFNASLKTLSTSLSLKRESEL